MGPEVPVEARVGHTPAELWATGPGFLRPNAPAAGSVLDVAPTVLRLLGVEPPVDLDGRPLVDLLASPAGPLSDRPPRR